MSDTLERLWPPVKEAGPRGASSVTGGRSGGGVRCGWEAREEGGVREGFVWVGFRGEEVMALVRGMGR